VTIVALARVILQSDFSSAAGAKWKRPLPRNQDRDGKNCCDGRSETRNPKLAQPRAGLWRRIGWDLGVRRSLTEVLMTGHGESGTRRRKGLYELTSGYLIHLSIFFMMKPLPGKFCVNFFHPADRPGRIWFSQCGCG
jgi:hypothetical protein